MLKLKRLVLPACYLSWMLRETKSLHRDGHSRMPLPDRQNVPRKYRVTPRAQNASVVFCIYYTYCNISKEEGARTSGGMWMLQ